MDEYLIETDFLFGLRASDIFHSTVQQNLENVKEKKVKLKILTSAIFEVRTVLYSQGKSPDEISKILVFMKSKLDEYGVEEESILFDDFILADSLRSKYKELTFFDSLHAAASQRRNVPIYGSDRVLKKLKFIVKSFEDG